MSAPQSSVLSVENMNIMITSAPRRVNLKIDDTDNLRIIENVYIPSEVISDVNELVKISTSTLDETHVHEENISDDIQNALFKSSTLIPDDTDVSEDDTSDSEHILVKSSMPV